MDIEIPKPEQFSKLPEDIRKMVLSMNAGEIEYHKQSSSRVGGPGLQQSKTS